jgi:hypothetical protein
MTAHMQAALALALLAPLAHGRVPVETVGTFALAALNATVAGRVHTAKPVSAPCYTTFGGQLVGRDNASCAVVEANYTNPLFRVQHFGAYMVRRTAYSCSSH